MRKEILILWVCCIGVPLSASAFPSGEKPSTVVPKNESLNVWVVEVTPSGDMRPLADARCTLVTTKHRPGPHGGRKEIKGRWHARTDAAGRAQFDGATMGPMEQAQVIVPFQGVAYRSETMSALKSDVSVRVYHVSDATSALRMRNEWTLELSDSMVRVTQVVHLENPTRTTIDYTNARRGFRVPTLSHGLSNNRVVAYGMFPKGPLHGDVSPSTGQGRVESEDGAVVYRGPVLPGDGLFFRVAYNIPYSQEALQLATVAEVPIREAVVSIVWTRKVHPRIRLNRGHRALQSEQGGFLRIDCMVNGRIDAGTPFVIYLDRMPVASPVPRWIALAGGIVIFSILLLLLAAVIVRRRKAAA